MGIFFLKIFQCWFLKVLGVVGFELGLEEGEMEVFYIRIVEVICGFYYYLKERFGSKVERKRELRKIFYE